LFVPGPGPNWKVEFDGAVSVEPVVEVVVDWSFEAVVVPVAVPAVVHELVGAAVMPDWSHELELELGVVVVLD
jgi:hypothetical protein